MILIAAYKNIKEISKGCARSKYERKMGYQEASLTAMVALYLIVTGIYPVLKAANKMESVCCIFGDQINKENLKYYGVPQCSCLGPLLFYFYLANFKSLNCSAELLGGSNLDWGD